MSSAPERPGPAPTGRAGRNLPAAIGVGEALGGLVIVVLAFAPVLWYPVVAVAVGIAMWEVADRFTEDGIHLSRTPLILGGQATMWLGWPWGPTGILAGFAGSVLVMMGWRLFGHGLRATPRNFLRDTAYAVLLLAWIPLMAAFAMVMVWQDQGAGRVFVLMISVVASDIGGYTAGVLFGKHPMVPAISPKKSWEGFAGSLLFAGIGAVASVVLILHGSWLAGLALGVVLVVVGTFGDLVESQIKRELEIKDMGTLLPGHGGIMDRIDSLLPAAFVTWAVLTVAL